MTYKIFSGMHLLGEVASTERLKIDSGVLYILKADDSVKIIFSAHTWTHVIPWAATEGDVV